MKSALRVEPGKRGTIFGHTGSGKTAGMIFLLRQQTVPVIVMDTKIEDKFLSLPNAIVVDGLENFDKATQIDNAELQPYIIVRPEPHEAVPETLDDFLFQLYNGCKNVCIGIDELYMFHVNGRASTGLTSLLTRGRSRGLTIIQASQRPKWVSLFCMSESDYFMLYNLNLPEDRDRVYGIVGQPQVLNTLAPYHFLWYTVRDNRLLGYTPVPLTYAPATYIEQPREKFMFV